MPDKQNRKQWLSAFVAPGGATAVTLWVLNTYPPNNPIWRYLAYWFVIPAVWTAAAALFGLNSQRWHEMAKRVQTKILIGVSTAILLLLVAVYYFRPRASSDLFRYSTIAFKNKHIPGTQLGAIVWRANYTDLRVTISNETENTYEDVNIVIDPDAWIAGMGLLQQVPKCILAPATQTQTSVDFTEDTSKKSYRVDVPVRVSLGDGIRIVCEKFTSHTGIEVVVATMGTPDFEGYYLVEEKKPNRGSKDPPTEVLANGSYKLGSDVIKTNRKLRVEVIP